MDYRFSDAIANTPKSFIREILKLTQSDNIISFAGGLPNSALFPVDAIRHAADRIAILYLGRLVESGPTDQVFARPLHPYTASLIASEPNPDPRKRRA